MLQLLLILPLIGSCLILIIPSCAGARGENSIENKAKIKNIALSVSLINLIISIFLWVQFDSNTSDYQFVYEFSKLSFCHFNIGIDSISLYFVLVTTFLTPIAMLSNHDSITKNTKLFFASLLLLETLQIAFFVVLDLFLFYIFFESILPVLFVLILTYGSGENRFRAAFYFFLYTLAGSLPMLLAILQIYSNVGSTDFMILSLTEISLSSQKLLWLGIFIAFAVKTPLFPVHGWLPLAHVEAPLACSILLAGTVLKLSTYGILRVLINFLPDASNYFSPLVQTLAIITLVYASFSTIVQQDIKGLVAYSSICHMAIVTLGLFSNSIIGIEGAILLAIGHSFVSPALFICVGGILYERFHTRNISYYRGIVLTMPVFTILFFIFTLANTGIPLSLNFLGEQLSLMGFWDRNPVVAAIGALGIVLSACYSIFLYNRISYGAYSPHLKSVRDITRREYNLLISLLIPTILLGVFPNVILDTLHLSVSTLLYNLPLTPLPADQIGSVLLFSNLAVSKTDVTPSDNRDLVDDASFIEWLVGFIDAEGNFTIRVRDNTPSIGFVFKIDLHSDDRAILDYICNRLQIGQTGVYDSGAVARWSVSDFKGLSKLIGIIDLRSLNTSKYLDYLKWKEAINLWRKAVESGTDPTQKLAIRADILNLKASMNKNRNTFFPIPGHKINISPYWFLGFLEGDGSFVVNSQSFQTTFAIELTYTEKPVLIALSEFIKGLIPDHLTELKDRPSIISVSEYPSRGLTKKPTAVLRFSHFQLLCEVITPFFDQLTFFTKKGLDYKDWKVVNQLKNTGLHRTVKGKILIGAICNRMNINRLSTHLDGAGAISQEEIMNTDNKIEEFLFESQIWVYKKGILVSGSPFNNFKEVISTLGLTARSKPYILKLKDTGKLYKNTYTFYSKPFKS